MSSDRFTVKAQDAIQASDTIRHRYNHSQIEIEHCLKALLEQKEGVIPPLLDR